MNRFRLGLHVPGNVIVACKRCNAEKRRDDQLPHLTLADSGWESFLSHDGSRCNASCKTCAYWRAAWPSNAERERHLRLAREKIASFRSRYTDSVEWSEQVVLRLRPAADKLYRDCQNFAASQIGRNINEALSALSLRGNAQGSGQ
jgi:hypothetical protein